MGLNAAVLLLSSCNEESAHWTLQMFFKEHLCYTEQIVHSFLYNSSLIMLTKGKQTLSWQVLTNELCSISMSMRKVIKRYHHFSTKGCFYGRAAILSWLSHVLQSLPCHFCWYHQYLARSADRETYGNLSSNDRYCKLIGDSATELKFDGKLWP